MFRSSEEEPVHVLKRSSKRKLFTHKGAPLTSCPALQGGSEVGLGMLLAAPRQSLTPVTNADSSGEAGDSVRKDREQVSLILRRAALRAGLQ